jgi:hypothetical protein
MQIRVQQEEASVFFRIVPISKATHLGGDLAWQAASDSQLKAWIRQGSAIGRWLLANGVAAVAKESRTILQPLLHGV